LAWWNRLDDRQRLLAEDYALRDENLSEHERDASWNQEAESIEIEAESDELDLPTSVLLDKGVIRRVYKRRVRLALAKPRAQRVFGASLLILW
jgi:hypothetical protein